MLYNFDVKFGVVNTTKQLYSSDNNTIFFLTRIKVLKFWSIGSRKLSQVKSDSTHTIYIS